MDEEVDCHWSQFPYLMCGDDATTHVIVYALMGIQRIEEEYQVCGDHAVVMAHNAIVNGFHIVAKPMVLTEIEWAEDPDD